MINQDIKTLNAIAQAIFDKKGINILVLDVRGNCTMTDYFVIAEGSVGRHLKSLCSAIKEQLTSRDLPVFHVEGEKDSDWIAMDCGDIFVHLFTPEMREKYAIEELWKQAEIVDVEITVSK